MGPVLKSELNRSIQFNSIQFRSIHFDYKVGARVPSSSSSHILEGTKDERAFMIRFLFCFFFPLRVGVPDQVVKPNYVSLFVFVQ